MKKLLSIIILIASFAQTVYAAPVSWDFTSGVLQPLQSGWSAQVKVPYLTATSTTATSTFAGGLQVNGGTFTVDYSTNFVGIGTLKPNVKLDVRGDTAVSSSIYTTRNSDNAFGADQVSRKSRGTLTAPTIVQAEDRIGGHAWQGYDGSAYRSLAFIAGEVDGTPGASDMPGRLAFYTTPDGSITPTEAMRITSANMVGIGTTSPYSMLSVAGRIVGQNYVSTSTTATSTFAGAIAIGTTSPKTPFVVQDTPGGGTGAVSIGRFTTATFAGISLTGGLIDAANYNLLSSPATPNLYLNRRSGFSIFFRENNVDQVTIAPTTGNLGVGTTSPYAKLSVEGNGVFGGSLGVTAAVFSATSTSATSTLAGGLHIGTGANSFLYERSNARVALGTTTTSGNFTVVGNISSGYLARFQNTNTAGAYQFQVFNSTGVGLNTIVYDTAYNFGSVFSVGPGGNAIAHASAGALGFGATTDVKVSLWQNNTEAFVIASSSGASIAQNIGIGSSTPYSKLSITNSITGYGRYGLYVQPQITVGSLQATTSAVLFTQNHTNNIGGDDVTESNAVEIIPSIRTSQVATTLTGLRIRSGSAGTNNYSAVFDQALGIGSSTPSGAQLAVQAGTGTTTVSIGSATSAGCIEWYAPNGTGYREYVSNAGTKVLEVGSCN